MAKQIIAQVKFNFPRDSDNYPSGKELEDALGGGYGEQQQGIGGQLMAGDAQMHVVHCAPDYLGKQNPDAVIAEDADRPDDVAASIFLQVGK